MKILVLSLGPIFPEAVHGGSQKILREIAIHLGKKHNVDIFCTERKDNNKPFCLAENVRVHPQIRFKETFPQPYRTPPYNLGGIISILNKEIKKYDVFYIHDSGLYFSFLINDIPSVWSLRDFIYPESVVGGLNFSRDAMIVNSLYTYLSYLSILQTYRQDTETMVHFIPNGIDAEHFKPVDSDSLRKEIGISNNNLSIIYPHRPEEDKGIFEVLKVVSALVNDKKMRDLKLLVPRYIDLNVSKAAEAIYDRIKKESQKLNIADNVIFHRWMTYNDMPAYYSLGDLTLSIGNFVESFPNVSLESLACGTPSISARVAAHRYVLPETIEERIDFGDIQSCVDIAYKHLIDKNEEKHSLQRNFIIDNFDFKKMLGAYENVIVNCRKKEPMPLKISESSGQYKLAPWCYNSLQHGVYNDYKYEYNKDKELLQLLSHGDLIVPNQENDIAIKKYHKEGYLTIV